MRQVRHEKVYGRATSAVPPWLMPIRFDPPNGELLEACFSLGWCISNRMIQQEIDPQRELVEEAFCDP